MPRGTRAIHGAEVTGNLHASGGQDGTFIQVVEPWLAITCWCERHVVQVEQIVFRELGVTYSCGASDCFSPDGDRSITPTLLSQRDVVLAGGVLARNAAGEPIQFGGITTPPKGDGRKMRRGYVVRMVEPRRRGPINRPSNQVVAQRRDRVEQMYQRGLKISDIADVLDVLYQTVHNDIAWLRRCGRVT